MPDLCYKRPFYYDAVEGKPFTFTTECTHNRIQIEVLLIFSMIGGQLWAPDDYWTQVGVLKGHSAATVDFNGSRLHISLGVRRLDVVMHRKKSSNENEEEKGVSEGAT